MVQCKDCGKRLSELSSHMRYSDCDWPNITNNAQNILIGSILGDASVDWSGKNYRILIRNTNREYLEEIEQELGIVCQSITVEKRSSTQDLYSLNTISHPDIEQIVSNLYEGRKKSLQIEKINPTILRHWYYQDGSYHRNRCRIQMVNFSDNKNRIEKLFEDTGIGIPYFDTSSGSFRAEFSVEQSERFLEYIEPEDITAFSYKFP